jgi:tetratricopeptide (TPR) repeat protein
VQTEHGISEEFEQYDDEREFRRLIRAVRFSKKHYLYFVCCNQVPKQNELITEIYKALDGKKIKVVKFKKRITDLLAELQKRKFDSECEAVFVQGLEYSISSDGKGDENALIHNLNISRDSFKKYFSCPLFLWLPEYALIKITRHAPDFFSVRSGTVYFSPTAEQMNTEISRRSLSDWSDDWLEVSSLSLSEKQKRLTMIKNLLANYEGLHQEKRNLQVEMRLQAQLAALFYSVSNYKEAISYFEKALKISRVIKHPQGESDNLNGLGSAFASLGNYRKALDYYEKSLEISKEIHNWQRIGHRLGNLGRSYQNLGKYRKAIDYYEQALKISKEVFDLHHEGVWLGNLGNIYISLGDYQNAIDYLQQALVITRKIGDKRGESTWLGVLGKAFNELSEYAKAIEFYQQALDISRENDNPQGESLSLNGLGAVYAKKGEYRKTIDYIEKSLTISKKIGYRLGEGNNLGVLGIAYDNLGEKEKACGLWKEAVAILEAIESPSANLYWQLLKENCEG